MNNKNYVRRAPFSVPGTLFLSLGDLLSTGTSYAIYAPGP